MKGNKLISLFFDTSTHRFEIALQIDTKVKVISHENTKTALEKSNLLLNRVLMSENIKLKDVDCLFTLLGPGSNTGIRIGLTICKTIYAFNHDIKLYGINTLKLLNKDKGISVLSDRANNLFSFDSITNKFAKIDKNKLSFNEENKIFVEDMDLSALELLNNYNPNLKIEKINIVQEMIQRKDEFEDFSSRENEFLPYYGVNL